MNSCLNTAQLAPLDMKLVSVLTIYPVMHTHCQMVFLVL